MTSRLNTPLQATFLVVSTLLVVIFARYKTAGDPQADGAWLFMIGLGYLLGVLALRHVLINVPRHSSRLNHGKSPAQIKAYSKQQDRSLMIWVGLLLVLFGLIATFLIGLSDLSF